MFEELFLSEEEEKIYQLQKLEKVFIISPKEMLNNLRKNVIDAKINYELAIKSYLDYKLIFSLYEEPVDEEETP